MRCNPKKLKYCMCISVLLLICGYHAGSLWLLLRMVAYILLLWCIQQLPKQRLNRFLFVLGIGAVALCVFGYFTLKSHIIWVWGLEVLAHMMDMFVLYGLATWILHATEQQEVKVNREHLLVFCAVAAVACCLQLNIPPLVTLVKLAKVVSHIYFVFGFCPYLSTKMIEEQQEL